MTPVNEFWIYNATRHQWLRDDEKSWTSDHDEAACFTDAQLAEDIRERETRDDDVTFVMGWYQ